MQYSRTELEQKVIQIVAGALDRDPGRIHLHSSLVDDLGAESIDFLDIRYRIETGFKIKIPNNEIWEGSLRLADLSLVTEQGVTKEALRLLKERLPQFRWDRFPNGVTKADLPRLITVSTIVDYLCRRFEPTPSEPSHG